jgi:hypothetical protein
VWSRIFGEAFGGIDQALARRMLELKAVILTHRKLLLHALMPHPSTAVSRPGQAEYVQALGRLYSGVANHGTNRVIVDSSKIPAYLYALGQVPDLDLRVVHLVRDPRATSYSWLRRRTDFRGALVMQQFPVWESAGRWVTWNATVPIVAKRIGAPVRRIHYESFVANPRETLRDVLSLVDDVCPVSESAWPFVGPNEVELNQTHTVWGNPSRLRTGRVQISLDGEWSTALSAFQKAVIVGLTYPLARHYGYFSARESKSAAIDREQVPPPTPASVTTRTPPPH